LRHDSGAPRLHAIVYWKSDEEYEVERSTARDTAGVTAVSMPSATTAKSLVSNMSKLGGVNLAKLGKWTRTDDATVYDEFIDCRHGPGSCRT
jgi:hypothetical protein